MSDAVKKSVELERIRLLPRRDWRKGYDIEQLIDYMTDALKTPHGTMRMFPHQAVALAEIHDFGGAFLPLEMGLGKTLVSVLAPVVSGSKRPLLLVPASLKAKTESDAIELAQHWQLPEAITIQSYETLGVDKVGYLEEVSPDIIICDEADALKDTSTARWKKVNRYVRDARKAGNGVKFVAMSGTAVGRHLRWYWHLLRLALGDLAPVPAKWPEMMEWSSALDAKAPWGQSPLDPGALLSLGRYDPKDTRADRGRDAFGDRLSSTPGIVVVQGAPLDSRIEITSQILDLPESLHEHFKKLREEWRTPDDQPFDRPVDLWRHARELACGFYYVWTDPAPEEWLDARTNWGTYLREILSRSQTLDSASELALAIDHGTCPDPAGYLAKWRAIKDTFTPQTEPVWVDDTALNAAAEWLEREQGLCWVEHRAFGARLEELTGIPMFGALGKNAAGTLIDKHKGPAIARQKTCYKGFNLQYLHYKNLIVSMTPTGDVYEQFIARTHRTGQIRPVVSVEQLFGCVEQLNGFQQAIKDVNNKTRTAKTDTKLGMACIDVPLPGDTNLKGWAWGKE